MAVAIASIALATTAARGQQDRTGRNDRTSGQEDSAQSDQSGQQSGQYDQRRRSDQYQNADRSSQDRSARTRGQQSDQSSQYSDRSQRQQSSNQSDRSGRDQSRDQSSRDQSGRGSMRQRLGVTFDQQGQGQNGLTVSDVQQGTPAAQAGLRAGDQIVAVDGRSINSPQQFFSYLSGQSGRQIPIAINRNGRQQNLQLTAEQGSGDTAWLGVFLQDSQDNNQEGAQVAQIYPAGPAARAGLQPGDIITEVDGQKVRSSSELISAIEEEQPGGRAQLTLLRNNQQMNLPVTLGSRESFTWRGQSDEQGQQGSQSSNWSQSGGQGGQHGSGGQWNQSGGQSGQHDHFANLPPFAMQLEHERRLYEQNQRIETQIARLQDEVRQLREALQQQRR